MYKTTKNWGFFANLEYHCLSVRRFCHVLGTLCVLLLYGGIDFMFMYRVSEQPHEYDRVVYVL